MASLAFGFNTNMNHKGKTYHVQTEDSGHIHAHIFTHLFADGGRIVATKKTHYGPLKKHPEFKSLLGQLMKAQHKTMLHALKDGWFDNEAEGAAKMKSTEITVDEARALITVNGIFDPTGPNATAASTAAPDDAPTEVHPVPETTLPIHVDTSVVTALTAVPEHIQASLFARELLNPIPLVDQIAEHLRSQR